METPAFKEREQWKGQIAGSWHARDAVRQARDGKLVADVNRWRVMTVELGCALLDLPRTPSNLRIVERRYQRLSHYKFHQVVQGGTTFYVTLTIPKSKAEHAQLGHRYMDSWASSTYLRAVQIEEFLSGTELWAKDRLYTPNLIPDAFFKLNATDGLFREDETGESDFYAILPKCWQYYNARALLKQEYKISALIVVWNCKDPAWVERIANAIRKDMPEDARRLFYLTSERAIDPFNPESVFDHIYFSPIDNTYYGFMG